MTRPSAPQRQRQPADRNSGGATVSRPHGAAARWRAFAGRYGWRAYALPVLAVASMLALVGPGLHRGSSGKGAGAAGQLLSPVASTPAAARASAPPAAAASSRLRADQPTASSRLRADQPTASSRKQALPPLALPPGPSYATDGTGVFTVVPGASGVLGKGRLYRFTVEVENGVTGVDPKAFAASVSGTLSNSRSWIATGVLALQRVDAGPVDFRISLVSSMTVRRLCGYSLPVETSCFDGGDARVVLNVARWVRGARVYAGDLDTYRIYAVNHEVGHALGHNHSHDCLANGLAPVMMQQTIGTRTATGKICAANPWPYPAGASDAPGAEQIGDLADNEFFQRNSS